jgi:chromosome segregation ATPase
MPDNLSPDTVTQPPQQPTEVEQLRSQLDQVTQMYLNRGQLIAQLHAEKSSLEINVYQLQKQLEQTQKTIDMLQEQLAMKSAKVDNPA